MRYCDTIEEAIRYFLKSAPNLRNGKTCTRRYEIHGRVCEIYKTDGLRGTRPRFKWVEPPPDQFRRVDMIDYVRDYMTPLGAPNPPPEPPPKVRVVRCRPAELDYGQLAHRADTAHYSNLLARLRARDLFQDQTTGDKRQ